MMRIIDGGTTPDEIITRISIDYLNNVPVQEIKTEYNIHNNQWHNILKRIYRQTGYKRRCGRPATPIYSEYVTKKGTRYNINRDNIDYGNYLKSEINTILSILNSIDWDYNKWMGMKTKDISENELKETIHNLLVDNGELTTREISEHINKKYVKYYSVEYTRTLLHRFNKNESWLKCNNKTNINGTNKGIPLTWSKK